MSKSYRTCYFRNQKDLWSPRPMRFWPSNKWTKVKSHRIERAQKLQLIYKELQELHR